MGNDYVHATRDHEDFCRKILLLIYLALITFSWAKDYGSWSQSPSFLYG